MHVYQARDGDRTIEAHKGNGHQRPRWICSLLSVWLFVRAVLMQPFAVEEWNCSLSTSEPLLSPQ